MKKIFLITVVCMLSLSLRAQTDENLGIIPAPTSVKKGNGTFVLDKTVALISDDQKNAALLNAYIVDKGGFALRELQIETKGVKSILLTARGSEKLPAEGYQISITNQQIKVVGKGAGLFYGVQSLMQLMPEKRQDRITIGQATIMDQPRFKYRGLHLDVCRHFFPVAFVKKYIDLMAMYKLNTFHWHLTDDQGWRIEIKKYPKLTTIGSKRPGTIAGNYPGTGGNDYEEQKGFYTQEEIREVVAYAASRYITVIPEIEMPGHASAAIAAYPELSCFPERDTFISDKTPWAGTVKGKLVQQTWGVFDDIFVPSENTFTFLENVLHEVIALFPSKYIHIGGDEAPKTYWKESKFCQDLIKEKNLKDEHGLQSYFIQRIEKYLNAKNRSIIGWDEILEGGLAPNATVMSWRGEEGGIEAAKLDHDVIMTPGGKIGLYLDHKQSNSPDEPLTIGGLSNYSLVYQYDPTPEVLTKAQKEHVIGVQANLWTEYIETPSKVEYQIVPRLMALAEIAWTPLDRKNEKNFTEERLPIHLAKLDRAGTNYWVPTPIGQKTEVQTGETFMVSLKPAVAAAQIFYTLDNFRPSENATRYTSPFKITVPKGTRKVLKTIVIAPSGKRSVVTETIYDNGFVAGKPKS